MAKKRDINKFQVGQFAASDAGHDRGTLYMILGIEGESVWLVNGTNKTIEKPKRKNISHVRRMNYIDPEINARLSGKSPLNNEDVLKAIQRYEARCNVIGG